MLKWFALKNKEGGKMILPPFIYFYYVIIVTPVILSFVNCALILSIVV